MAEKTESYASCGATWGSAGSQILLMVSSGSGASYRWRREWNLGSFWCIPWPYTANKDAVLRRDIKITRRLQSAGFCSIIYQCSLQYTLQDFKPSISNDCDQVDSIKNMSKPLTLQDDLWRSRSTLPLWHTNFMKLPSCTPCQPYLTLVRNFQPVIFVSRHELWVCLVSCRTFSV